MGSRFGLPASRVSVNQMRSLLAANDLLLLLLNLLRILFLLLFVLVFFFFSPSSSLLGCLPSLLVDILIGGRDVVASFLATGRCL